MKTLKISIKTLKNKSQENPVKTGFLHLFYLLVCLISACPVMAQYSLKPLDSAAYRIGEGVEKDSVSFRGLSVVNNKVIWVSGSRGTIARSNDKGKHFELIQLKGYEKSDFRDIEGFDEKKAIVMSSGSPAYILKTIDGGVTWKEVFKSEDTLIFLDAMDFWDDKKGLVIGDPLNGRFFMMNTTDAGENWKLLDSSKAPSAKVGEALFAASGTCLRCWNKNMYGFVTGGSDARLFIYKRWKKKMITPIPIVHGNPGQGAYSFTVSDDTYNCVGGDFGESDRKVNLVSWHKDAGIFGAALDSLPGYRSCVEGTGERCMEIVTGPNGTDLYNCGDIKRISKIGFHVVKKAKRGKVIYLAGSKGRIALLKD